MILEISLFKYCSNRCKSFYELLKENRFNLMKGVGYIFLGSGTCFSYEINKYWLSIFVGLAIFLIGFTYTLIFIMYKNFTKNILISSHLYPFICEKFLLKICLLKNYC